VTCRTVSRSFRSDPNLNPNLHPKTPNPDLDPEEPKGGRGPGGVGRIPPRRSGRRRFWIQISEQTPRQWRRWKGGCLRVRYEYGGREGGRREQDEKKEGDKRRKEQQQGKKRKEEEEDSQPSGHY